MQGCQLNKDEYLDEYVYDSLLRMYSGLESQRDAIDAERIIDIRYEDLVADPVTVLESIYQELDLGDFEAVRPELTEYVESLKDYQPNRHELDPALRAEIGRRWASYFKRYGYSI